MILEDVWFNLLELSAITSAIECGIFTIIHQRSVSADQLGNELGLKANALVPLLNCLVALKILEKQGENYRNSEEALLSLGAKSSFYRGQYLLEMRKTPMHDRLTQFLKTGHAPLMEGGKSFSAM